MFTGHIDMRAVYERVPNYESIPAMMEIRYEDLFESRVKKSKLKIRTGVLPVVVSKYLMWTL